MAALGTQAERLAAGGEARATAGRLRPVAVRLAAYAAIGGVAAAVAASLGHDPLACEGWLGGSGAAPVLTSLGIGVCVGALTVAASRVMVRRVAWARALHAALRPTVRGAGDLVLLAIALASAVAEEILFRGVLVPVLGVLGSAVVFGALHQIRGPARWGWMGWATLMGVLFGGIFVATGSLAGPIAAHAIINAANLRFLRDRDPSAAPRSLGGLLRRS